MVFLNCQLQSCLANALEDCADVPGEVSSNITCDSNVIYVLSTLVSFDDWVELFTHETRKADTGLLGLCAGLLNAKVLLAKLNATLSTDSWSAICKR